MKHPSHPNMHQRHPRHPMVSWLKLQWLPWKRWPAASAKGRLDHQTGHRLLYLVIDIGITTTGPDIDTMTSEELWDTNSPRTNSEEPIFISQKPAFLNTFETIPDTPKTNLLIVKPQKSKPQKHHFAMFKNNPLFFINFLFFQHTVFVFEKLCFAENTIKIVFSGKHSFSETQLVKPTFSTMSKTPFSKKRCHFWFWAISTETPIFIVFPGLHCFGPKKNFGQNR